jgi:N-acetylglucosamine-6-phosphate deacetylase
MDHSRRRQNGRLRRHILAPAYFDQHIHGSAGHDVMEATEPGLAGINRFLARITESPPTSRRP